MLPPANRLRRSIEFASVVRGGVRARRGRLVVHRLITPSAAGPTAPKVGLIVGKNVGTSVQRHRVSRRLRAQLSLRLAELPLDSATVVRALPGAADAASGDLGRDLDRGFAALGGRR